MSFLPSGSERGRRSALRTSENFGSPFPSRTRNESKRESAFARFRPVHLIGLAALILFLFILGPSGCGHRASGPLTQDTYVWQRVWTQALERAVDEGPAQSGDRIREMVPLAAEVVFQNGHPSVIRPALSFTALKTAPACGLALRIGPFPGPFAGDDANGKYLQALAYTLVSDARKAGCPVAELQIDFDCAESKLAGYRVWVAAIRHALQTIADPVPVSITTLPSWMDRAEFGPLVREAGSFVLQAHSAELPSVGAPPLLCDPNRTRCWVQKAGSYGVPFRVALPTYTSLVAVNPAGKVVGVSNEGPRPAWPADAKTITAAADPRQLAQLVREWTHDRPAALSGILWYRLPVSTDHMNWRWPTLAAVMAGRAPRSALRVEASLGNPSDILLVNEGELDEALPAHIGVRWDSATLVSADALSGFALESAADHVIFTPSASGSALPPGERRVIGWIRLETPTKIYVTEN